MTGVPADRIEFVLQADWHHLISDKRILDSPYYLRERGQPVVAVWGLGFEGARHTPQTAAAIARNFKSSVPGGAYVWAGGSSSQMCEALSNSLKCHHNGELFLGIWIPIQVSSRCSRMSSTPSVHGRSDGTTLSRRLISFARKGPQVTSKSSRTCPKRSTISQPFGLEAP